MLTLVRGGAKTWEGAMNESRVRSTVGAIAAVHPARDAFVAGHHATRHAIPDLHYGIAGLTFVLMPIVVLVGMNIFGWLGQDLVPASFALGVVGVAQAALTRSMVDHPDALDAASSLAVSHSVLGAVGTGFMASSSGVDTHWPMMVSATLVMVTVVLVYRSRRSEGVATLGIAAGVLAGFELALLVVTAI